MQIHEFCVPPVLIYGPGSLARLPEEAGRLGTRALVVTGRGALRRTGVLGRIEELLRGAGLGTVLFEGVEADPSVGTVDRGAAAARGERCDMIVVAGGGSALDAGKAIAAMAMHPGSTGEYLEGRPLTAEPLPCVCVPTTAGTGAEVTRNSVLTNREKGCKKSIRDRRLIPVAAIVDPELTHALPPDVTASTGMDALAQLIEPLVSRKATPLTDALALDGIELIGRSLARAVADGGDMEARADMSLAAMMSGMALANAGLGAAHALSHPLGLHFGIPHGYACALLLPGVMEYNLAFSSEKYARVAEAMGEAGKGLSGEAAARRAVERVRELSREIGIRAPLSSFGIREGDLDRIAREARGSSLEANPRTAGDSDLAGILRNVL